MENLYRGNEGASLEHQWILRLPDPKHATVPALQNMALERLTPSIFVVGDRDLERVLTILSENGILVDVHKM